MDANLLLAVVVLLAILVGAALVVVVHLSMTLRSVRAALEVTSRNLNRLLADSGEVTQKLKKISADLEKGAAQASKFLQATGQLSAAVHQARDTVRKATAVGSAVGPAVAAFVQALRAPSRAEGDRGGAEPTDAQPEEPERSEPTIVDEINQPNKEVPHE